MSYRDRSPIIEESTTSNHFIIHISYFALSQTPACKFIQTLIVCVCMCGLHGDKYARVFVCSFIILFGMNLNEKKKKIIIKVLDIADFGA